MAISSEGLFAADSPLRRAARESVTMMCGGRALLMQIAHPLVAAGVMDHSEYRSDPLGRLERTTSLMMNMILGDGEEVQAALRRFHRAHVPIKGTIKTGAGRFQSGTPYTAQDPALKLWVHATLIDSLLLVYELFVSPLSTAEREWYYQDSKMLGRKFGIPESMIPPTLADHYAYMREMLAGDTLAVTDETRDIAAYVLAPDVWLVPRAAARIVRFVTAGTLPEPLRGAYGLRWNPRRQAALDAFSASVRGLLPVTPTFVRRPAESRLDWLAGLLFKPGTRGRPARNRPFLRVVIGSGRARRRSTMDEERRGRNS